MVIGIHTLFQLLTIVQMMVIKPSNMLKLLSNKLKTTQLKVPELRFEFRYL